MTRKAAQSLSAWIFILSVVLVLTGLFFLHWALGAIGAGVILWNLSGVLWTCSKTGGTVDEE